MIDCIMKVGFIVTCVSVSLLAAVMYCMHVTSLLCNIQTARQSGWGRGGVYQGFMVSVVGITVYRGAFFGLYDTSQLYYGDGQA